MDKIFDNIEYLWGVIPVVLRIIWELYRKGKTEKIKDYKTFLKELDSAYDDMRNYKDQISELVFEIKNLKNENKKLIKKIEVLAESTTGEYEGEEERNGGDSQ